MINLNFSVSEFIKSDIAKAYKIDNTPDITQIDNIFYLIFYCLQPLRNKLKKQIIITSGFRCRQLNKLVGGVSNSQHLEGKAADFIVKGEKVSELINFIVKSGIEYDQLINEYDKWVHISYSYGKNRHQVLKLA